MNFAQVCGVVTCAVTALVGCGGDRAEDVGSSDDSPSDLVGVAGQEVGLTAATSGCVVTLAGPTSTTLLNTTLHLSATPSCSAGTPEVQFYHRVGTAGAWTILQAYSAALTFDFDTTGSAAGTHQFRARVRMVGTTTATSSATASTFFTHAPVAVNDSRTFSEDMVAMIDVVANDSDADGDTLTVTAVTAPGHGTAVISSGHVVRYTPALDYNGSDSFGYTISDGHATASATVAITVTSVDDPPVAVDDAATLGEDGSAAIDVIANDSDVDGDPLTVTSVTAPGHGAAVITGAHVVTYTPAADFNGTDAFTYEVTDSSGAPATATVTVTVTPVNDAPVASDDAETLLEDGSVSVDVVANDVDVDGDALTVTLITAPAHGLALITDAHHVSYTPAPNFHGSDALTYTISDGTVTASATLALTVTSVNDAPVAVADSAGLAEDGSLAIDVVGNDGDADGDALTVTAVTAPAHGTATITGAHEVTYTPAADYNGSDGFSYTVSDGAATASAAVAIAITAVNDAPIAAADSASLAEDASASLDLAGNDSDVDGDALTITAVTAPAHGTATITDAHHVLYTPAADYHGGDAFLYTISDGTLTASAAVTLTVTSVNDAPVASAASASTFDDTPVTVALVASDVDGDPLTLAIATPPAHGSLGAIAGGHVTYTPGPGYVGPDSFAFAASDGALSATAAVAITVVASVCGNGVREGVHEECDDGNAQASDGCESTCRLTCGSGTGADRATVDAASGHCFAAYDGTGGSYQQAAALCASAGGHLASITSAGEDAAAFAAVRAGDTPWLGADDLALEGTFAWTTGEPLAYTHFHAGKPDNAGNADCAQYLTDGTWSDTGCAGAAVTGTLCEIELVRGTQVIAAGGTGPRGVAIADFNGDGFADVATASATSSNVAVQFGNGAGGFRASGTYATGTGPAAIVAGDFNGDGSPDLATANASTVTILTGSAAGAFTAGASVAIPAGAAAIAAADLDGDGQLDLAVGGASALQLLHGNGAGGFAAAGTVSLAALGAPAAIATGDFDHDGRIDLAVATSTKVLIVRGLGAGVFAAPTVLVTAADNRGVVAADLNGDGNLDLAVAGGPASVTIYTGSGLGGFTLAQTLAAGGAPLRVVAGDFDGDGGVDLVAITASFATLFHGAAGVFTQLGGPVATGGNGAAFAAAGSLDGDAALDLVVGTQTGAGEGVLYGGALGLAGARGLAAGTASADTIAGDFNEDGRRDLAVLDPGTSKLYVLTQNPAGVLVLTSTVTLQTNANSSFGIAADFNNDGHLDIAVANVAFSSVAVVLGAGNGTFGALHVAGTGNTPRRFSTGDFNGDGKLDLAVAATVGNSVTILINASNGNFGRVADVAAGTTPAATAVGDFDGDGKLDLAVATLGDPSVKVARGNGNGTFAAAVPFATAAGGEGLVAKDLDGDGKLDLAVTCAATSSVSVLLGTGTGSFAAAVSYAAGPGPAALVASDVDGDGRLDLVTGNAGGDVSVLHADGAGGYAATRFAIGVAPAQVTAADLDGDGRVDLAVTTRSAIVTTLYSPR
jgi:cysteine-rich repeat protein